MERWLCISLWLSALAAIPCHAQESVVPNGELEEYYRLLEINGATSGLPLIYRSPSSFRSAAITDSSGPWNAHYGTIPHSANARFTALPVEARAVFNSGYPAGINDGALWSGRGASGAVAAGGTLRAG